MKRKQAIMVWPFAFTITLNAQWTGTTNIYNTNSGNVGIGTSTPINKLQVIGDIYRQVPPCLQQITELPLMAAIPMQLALPTACTAGNRSPSSASPTMSRGSHWNRRASSSAALPSASGVMSFAEALTRSRTRTQAARNRSIARRSTLGRCSHTSLGGDARRYRSNLYCP